MSKYCTKDNYYEARGIDLEIELKGSNYDDESNAVDIFITQCEQTIDEALELYAKSNCSDSFKQEIFKLATIHQIDYVRKYGDTDDLCPRAKQVLKQNGFMNYIQTGGGYRGY